MPTCINCGKEIINQEQLRKEANLCASCAEKGEGQKQQNQEGSRGRITNITFWSLIGGGMILTIGIVLVITEIVDQQVGLIIIIFGLVDVVFNAFFYWFTRNKVKNKRRNKNSKPNK
ncbi:MAG: hypothetical protein GF308_20515 [Candidatus Heimdallarchaeota archaeon]|nr:hypothetical protein [Candidatus Heimdallarchaeota archaeon]